MNFYLLVLDSQTGALSIEEYGEDERADAFAARFTRELVEQDHPEIEVVLLGAESLDDLKRTHSRYFKSRPELTHEMG